MDGITLVQLRAIIGDDDFNNYMTPDNIKDLIHSNRIKYRHFVEVDNKLANSFKVQSLFYKSPSSKMLDMIKNSDGVLKIHPDLNQYIVDTIVDKFNNDPKSTKNVDGSIDYNGNVDLSNHMLSKIPIKFNYVSGDFMCSDNLLTNLEGSPKKVGGRFYCYNNQLTTLKGAPMEVEDFHCNNNLLTSLEFAPSVGVVDFVCQYNKLTTLKGAPREVGGGFVCNNNSLTTLEGSPKKVGGVFYCYHNQLTTLKGGPDTVVDFSCSNNQLTNLEGSPREAREFYCQNNKLTSLKGAPEKISGEFRFYNNPDLSGDEIYDYKAKLRSNYDSLFNITKESYNRFSDFYFKG